MTCSLHKMPSSTFLFVEVQQSGKVPPRKDIRTAIQKHVMRDIGATRRGKPMPRRQPKSAKNGRIHETSLFSHIVSQTHHEEHPIRQMQPRIVASSQELVYTEPNMKIPWPVSGGCRTDPFMRFPIHMTSETSSLVDYGESAYSLLTCI